MRRAQLLLGYNPTGNATDLLAIPPPPPTPLPSAVLRDVYERWAKSRPLTQDSAAACGRALMLFEGQTGNPPIHLIARAQGDAFRAWLQTLPTTSKTARDRLNRVKTLLKYAAQELEILPRSPWVGLDIRSRTTAKRQPWAEEHLKTLFGHDIWRRGELPTDKKAGGIAAYWIPLLALYTGARCSELCQLKATRDLAREGASGDAANARRVFKELQQIRSSIFTSAVGHGAQIGAKIKAARGAAKRMANRDPARAFAVAQFKSTNWRSTREAAIEITPAVQKKAQELGWRRSRQNWTC